MFRYSRERGNPGDIHAGARRRGEEKPPPRPLSKGGVGEADGGLRGRPPKVGGGFLRAADCRPYVAIDTPCS